MEFSELNFCPELLKGVTDAKFKSCTPIQESVIPVILQGKDIFGLAQTGTGKTAAFLLPTMERIARTRFATEGEGSERKFPEWKKGQFVLILVPTRELAEQVHNDVEMLCGDTGIESVSIYGGTSYDNQKEKLKEGVEIVIGTPGRLIDLYKSHSLDLKQVRSVIFDEADRMFDMGFKDDMQFLLHRIPRDRQMLLFSATLNFDVQTTAYRFGADPVEFNVSKDEVKAENVDDKIMHLSMEEKPQFLLSIMNKTKPKQVIVFSNFKNNVHRVATFLNENGYHAVAISSLLTQKQRNRVMEQFTGEGKHNILVATDVAARGLDIDGVDLVVNFELPDDPENYVHRIGRTGRAGETGTAISFVGDKDVEALMRIEEYLKNKLEAYWLDETDLVAEYKRMPSERDLRKDREKFSSPKTSRKNQRGGGRGGRGPSKPKRRRQRDDSPSTAESRDRNQNRNRNRNRRNDEDGSKEGEKSGEVHRDRRTGRHQERPSGAVAKKQTRKKTSHKKRRPNNKRRRNINRRRPQEPKTLTGKIKSAFKKLFG